MPEYFVDLTGSDDETPPGQSTTTRGQWHPTSDDLEEVVVRRVNRRRESDTSDDIVVSQINRRPPENPDDVVIVSSNVRQHPHPHIPEFPHPGTRDYGRATPRAFAYPVGYISELGRAARTAYHRPAQPRPQAVHQTEIPTRFWQSITSMLGRAMGGEDEFDPPYHPDDPHEDIWPPAGLGGGRDSALQRAMFRSMFDTSQHEQLDPEKIEKPPMSGTSNGYTRDLNEKCELLCAKCDNLLGEGADKSALVYFRNCGHVYCGSCVEAIGKLRGKAKKCSAADCEGKKRQRIVFTQVYV